MRKGVVSMKIKISKIKYYNLCQLEQRDKCRWRARTVDQLVRR